MESRSDVLMEAVRSLRRVGRIREVSALSLACDYILPRLALLEKLYEFLVNKGMGSSQDPVSFLETLLAQGNTAVTMSLLQLEETLRSIEEMHTRLSNAEYEYYRWRTPTVLEVQAHAGDWEYLSMDGKAKLMRLDTSGNDVLVYQTEGPTAGTWQKLEPMIQPGDLLRPLHPDTGDPCPWPS